jgi:3-oxoacyl-[acyl-carrier protein] reductase
MILISGASRGIGLGIAQRLHGLDYEVMGISRSRLESPYKNFQVDISNHEEIRKFALYLKREKKYPKVLINAAGIASMNLALMTTPMKSRELLEVNLLGTINMCQVLAPLIARAGGGSIINFSSIAVSLGLSGEAVYTASKAGVEAYTRVLARELAGVNIRANCIAPGPISTDLLKGVTEIQIDDIVKRQIIPSQFTISDVCDVVEVLLDERFSSISGEVIHIGGV